MVRFSDLHASGYSVPQSTERISGLSTDIVFPEMVLTSSQSFKYKSTQPGSRHAIIYDTFTPAQIALLLSQAVKKVSLSGFSYSVIFN